MLSLLKTNIIVLFIILFAGCSSKQYDTKKEVYINHNLDEDKVIIAKEKDFNDFMNREISSIKKLEYMNHNNELNSYDSYIDKALKRFKK